MTPPIRSKPVQQKWMSTVADSKSLREAVKRSKHPNLQVYQYEIIMASVRREMAKGSERDQ